MKNLNTDHPAKFTKVIDILDGKKSKAILGGSGGSGAVILVPTVLL